MTIGDKLVTTVWKDGKNILDEKVETYFDIDEWTSIIQANLHLATNERLGR